MNFGTILKRFKHILISFNILAMLFIFLSCREIPTNPDNPFNCDLELLLKTSDVPIGQKKISDSLGRPVEFIIAYIFPAYVKNTTLKIISPNSLVVFDTNFFPLSKGDRDTLKFTKKIIWPGQNKVIVTAGIDDGDVRLDSATLTGLSANSPPDFNVVGDTNIITGQTCSLTIKIVDSDVGQKYTMMVKNNGPFIVMDTTLYTWKPDDGFSGVREITFKVLDDGNPPLTVTKPVKVKVTDKKPLAPKNLRIKEYNYNKSTVTFTWDIVTDAMVYRVFKSKTIDNGYTIFKDSIKQPEFIDKLDSTVSYYYVIARNIYGESKPSNIVSSLDTGNVAPEWNINDTLKINIFACATYTLNLKDTCRDINRDSLTFSLKSKNSGKDTIVNGIYTFKSKGDDTGIFKAKIAVSDPSGLSDTLFILINVKAPDTIPSPSDSIGPLVVIISPAVDSAKTSDSSAQIRFRCTDSSNVASVTCFLDGKEVGIEIDSANIYYTNKVSLLKGSNTFVFTAKDASIKANKTVSRYTIVYDPTMIDKVGPILKLQDSAGVSTTNSSSINIKVLCKDDNGIASVTCKKGTLEYTVQKGIDDIYIAEVRNLTVGLNELVFTATDNSTNANKNTLNVTIKYDPTLDDKQGPIFRLIYPQTNNYRLFKDSVTIKISCSDTAGVGSVVCAHKGSNIPVQLLPGSSFSAHIVKLTPAGSDTILFTAKDKSSNGNTSTLEVIVCYNTLIDSVFQSTPVINAERIPVNLTFTWDGGNDTDKEPVYFKVIYGTSEFNLENQTAEVTTKTASITNAIANSTKYFWQVIAYSKIYKDTIKSAIRNFTTIDETPEIIYASSDVTVPVGQSATFTVTAKGTNLQYQWKRGTVNIDGANNATYKINVTTDSDHNAKFKCIVSNNANTIESKEATLFLLTHKVIYESEGHTSGEVPKNNNYYKEGDEIKVAGKETLERTGFSFGGWKIENENTIYKENQTFKIGTTNVTFNAVWNAIYTVTFDDQGATVAPDPKTKEVIYPETTVVSLPSEPKKDGYIFGGWFTSTSGNGSPFTESTPVKQCVTVYVKWIPAYQVNENTISYYKFDESAGDSLLDETGQHGGKIVGATRVPGYFGNGIMCTPSGYAQFDTIIPDGTTNGTVEFFFKFNDTFNSDSIYSLFGNRGARVHVIYKNKTLYFQKNHPDLHKYVSGAVTLTAGQWYKIAVTWGSKGMKIFLDDVMIANNDDISDYKKDATNESYYIFYAGYKMWGGMEAIGIYNDVNFYFDGVLDLIHISSIERY